MMDRPHEKTCPDLPKDTLGTIELTQEARELLKEGKEAKKKFALAREWDANVVYLSEKLKVKSEKLLINYKHCCI